MIWAFLFGIFTGIGIGWIVGVWYGVRSERDEVIGALIRYADAQKPLRVTTAPYDREREPWE